MARQYHTAYRLGKAELRDTALLTTLYNVWYCKYKLELRTEVEE